MKTDNTATLLIFILVIIIGIFTLTSLAQSEPDSPDVYPVFLGNEDWQTIEPNATHNALPTSEGNVRVLIPPFVIEPTTTPLHPVIPQAMTPTIRPVIIPKWGD